MNEALTRRLSEKNQQEWGLPDLFLIDGGKGQLAAAIKARDAAGVTRPMIGLAKREEEIVVHRPKSLVVLNVQGAQTRVVESQDFSVILLPQNSDVVKLLQRIRDESHRFAVSYHSVLKGKRQTASLLEDIPGIGPATRKKLIRHFGSLRGVKEANLAELSALVGTAKAKQISQAIKDLPRAMR
jgi:excinuclease ABC subunit C